MTKSVYKQVVDGEWNSADRKNNWDQCCDCGLVHRINYRITAKNKIEYQVFRDERLTAAARRRFKFSKDDD